MANKKFFQLSDTAKEVTGFFINPDCFLRLYKENLEIEWNSTLYHYLFDNVPYAFKDIPLLYNNIKQYLAVRLNIHVYDVHLVGSAQLGFSLSPPKYGKAYSDKSDLDMVVVNERLFNAVAEEASRWRDDYKNGDVEPGKNYSVKNWDDNYQRIPNYLGRGFIDNTKIPSFERYPHVKSIYGVMAQLRRDLHDYHGFYIGFSSIRIYRDIQSFYAQVMLNANNAMRNV